MSKSLVLISGKPTDKISVFDHGFLYGDGVFDTFRIFNGKPFLIHDHIARLFNSAKNINLRIPVSKKKLHEIVKKFCQKNTSTDLFARIIVTRGTGNQGLKEINNHPTLIVIIAERKFEPLRKIKAIISDIPKFSKDTSGRSIKSLNYGLAAEALQLAKKQKANEAIFFNEQGYLSEATTSNIFLVKKNTLYTPPLTSGALPGITRKLVLKKFNVIQKNLTRKDLLAADEVFLTGTVDFVTSVQSVDTKIYTQFAFAEKIFRNLSTLISHKQE